MASRCRHTRVPSRADVSARRILLRCTSCGKTSWVRASRCESCWDRAGDHQHKIIARADRFMQLRREGVGVDLAELMAGPLPPSFVYGCADCFLGLKPHQIEQCCCRNGDLSKCENCLRATTSTHICVRVSALEADHEIKLALMPKPRTYTPSRDAQSRAAAMDQSQGIRVKKYD